jgi:predicted small lipoprotein YifL
VKDLCKPSLVAVLSVALSLAACGIPGPDAQPGLQSPAETAPAPKPVRIVTDPAYTGSASGELSGLADKINLYVSSKLFVGVARPSDAAAKGLEELARKLDPGHKQIILVEAQWSWSELDSVKDILVKKYMGKGQEAIQSVGLNTALDAVVVGVLGRPGIPIRDNPAVIEIAHRYGDVVVFRETSRIDDAIGG